MPLEKLFFYRCALRAWGQARVPNFSLSRDWLLRPQIECIVDPGLLGIVQSVPVLLVRLLNATVGNC